MLQKTMPAANFHIHCYDCAVINPNYVPENSNFSVSSSGKNMSILVTVSGNLTYGESGDTSSKSFSENFVLAPSPDVGKTKNKGKLTKDWLVQSQNFRLVT